MSRTSTATINYTLTNYAQGFANDISKLRELVNALCPMVQVPGATGQYKIFSDVNSFQTYSTLRGMGGSRRRIEFSATDGSFACKPHALEVTVDDHEREQAGIGNAVGQLLLDQGKIRSVVQSASLSYAKRVIDFVAANTTAVSGQGVWSNADIDPIDQIDAQLINLATATGGFMRPKVVLGLTAWNTLRSHPKTKARTNGVQVGGISRDQFQALLTLPADVVIGQISYNTAKPGNTVSKSQMLGDLCYIAASVPNPTTMDPSPFKCFTTGVGGVESVKTYRDERSVSDVHAVDWNEDIVLTAASAIIRLTIT